MSPAVHHASKACLSGAKLRILLSDGLWVFFKSLGWATCCLCIKVHLLDHVLCLRLDPLSNGLCVRVIASQVLHDLPRLHSTLCGSASEGILSLIFHRSELSACSARLSKFWANEQCQVLFFACMPEPFMTKACLILTNFFIDFSFFLAIAFWLHWLQAPVWKFPAHWDRWDVGISCPGCGSARAAGTV